MNINQRSSFEHSKASFPLSSFEWRSIGPHRGGRVVAVAGDPSDSQVFYFGACGGGVWKTYDGGIYWENVSDKFFKTASVGAIAVSESDPNVVYAGMGESCIRGNVSYGDGVYKSMDRGKTWVNIGLKDTRHIARIRIHPQDPNLVYIAALGHAFGANAERGVFRSKDGGSSWERILYHNDKTGAIDLSMDPNNPRTMYASLWETLRTPWTFTSGGPHSGIFKSTNGGDSWSEITNNPGLPKGLKGRIGVAVSPAQTDRVWAIVEAKTGGLFRSDDGGHNWEMVSGDPNLVQRPWYYSHVFADPINRENVYVLNLKAWKSTDGGYTFRQLTTPHGDNHDLWIDPTTPGRMIEGNDGGACISFNGGNSWSTIYNQPTSQFYHLTTDNQFPYRVYATQQDNTAISSPSRSTKGAITWSDCYTVGSSESGHIAVRPDNSNIVYSGAIGSSPGGGDSLLRYDHRTNQSRIISVWPEIAWGSGVKDHKYRFQWTYPILISHHDPNILYVAANMIFRSKDEGSNWEAISPDLTRGDVSKMEASGGPITIDATSVEHYGTIFSLAQSFHKADVFWAGSDDGLVHISMDGGSNWDNVTPKDMPEWTRIDMIEPSRHDHAKAYMAATRYKMDDPRPFLYVTTDYGETWKKITEGIPNDDFTRVIREDSTRPGLLYAGTETGVYISFNDGKNWVSLQLNLPAVPISDMVVKDNDLVIATNGRSFWILDDLTVLRQFDEEIMDNPTHLFQPVDTYRIPPPVTAGKETGPGKNYDLGLGIAATYYETQTSTGETIRTLLDSGTNPPNGVIITYHIKKRAETEARLTFVDSSGQTIKSFSSKSTENKHYSDKLIQTEPGMNRFVWNMHYPDPNKVNGTDIAQNSLQGPLAPPGHYQVNLSIGKESQTQTFRLLKDPRVIASQKDLKTQFDLLVRITDKVTETHNAINRLRNVRKQMDEWISKARSSLSINQLSQSAESVNAKLSSIEEELIQTKERGKELDRIALPSKLNAKLAELTSVVSSADSAPTVQSYDVFNLLSSQADSLIKRLQDVIDNDVADFIGILHKLEIPEIVSELNQ